MVFSEANKYIPKHSKVLQVSNPTIITFIKIPNCGLVSIPTYVYGQEKDLTYLNYKFLETNIKGRTRGNEIFKKKCIPQKDIQKYSENILKDVQKRHRRRGIPNRVRSSNLFVCLANLINF